jgi:hypothetical protein
MSRLRRARESILTVGAGGRGAIAVVVCAFALGACGDDEPEGPSKAEYLKEANEICEYNASEIQGIFFYLPENRKPDSLDIRLFVEELWPALDIVVLQVRELEEPEEELPDVERLMSIYERLSADAKAAGKSDAGSRAFVNGLPRRVKLIDETAKAAELPACGGKV